MCFHTHLNICPVNYYIIIYNILIINNIYILMNGTNNGTNNGTRTGQVKSVPLYINNYHILIINI